MNPISIAIINKIRKTNANIARPIYLGPSIGQSFSTSSIFAELFFSVVLKIGEDFEGADAVLSFISIIECDMEKSSRSTRALIEETKLTININSKIIYIVTD